MNSFVNSIQAQTTKTTNGMVAYKSSMDSCVDLFYKIGASRGKNIIPEFLAAKNEDSDIALRIVQWARDVRGGAGERQLFKDILVYLEKTDREAAIKLARKIPEIGRWDDLLAFNSSVMKEKVVYPMIKDGLKNGNGLLAKWLPRQGKVAAELRKALGYSPKSWRKTLVQLTDVVEQKMCANDWETIEFNKVPSLAHARYRNAFFKNAPSAYSAYTDALAKGETKINAGAVYPYDIVIPLMGTVNQKEIIDSAVAQWDALPNYVGGNKILPMVDVSGSMMMARVGNKTALGIAVSLGLYLADKNKGSFKDTFLTFSATPELLKLHGNLFEKINQLKTSKWGINTDIESAFLKVLKHAKEFNVPQSDMPEYILILSDMQFDEATSGLGVTDLVRSKYKKAGYDVPKVVFWNLHNYDSIPARSDEKGIAMISGFSPSIMKSVLGCSLDSFTPRTIMLEAVMIDRYSL